MEINKIMDGIAGDMDGDEQIALIESFLSAKGSRGLIFYYQVNMEMYHCMWKKRGREGENRLISGVKNKTFS